MYWHMRSAFMPSKRTGSASVRNSCSILTASVIILRTAAASGLERIMLKSRQAKSVCIPSSREISSLEKVRPGMRPRFLSQKIEAKEPLKKIPSTAAKATRREAKVEFLSQIHRMAQSAFFRMHGTGKLLVAFLNLYQGIHTGINGIEEVV